MTQECDGGHAGRVRQLLWKLTNGQNDLLSGAGARLLAISTAASEEGRLRRMRQGAVPHSGNEQQIGASCAGAASKFCKRRTPGSSRSHLSGGSGRCRPGAGRWTAETCSVNTHRSSFRWTPSHVRTRAIDATGQCWRPLLKTFNASAGPDFGNWLDISGYLFWRSAGHWFIVSICHRVCPGGLESCSRNQIDDGLASASAQPSGRLLQDSEESLLAALLEAQFRSRRCLGTA